MKYFFQWILPLTLLSQLVLMQEVDAAESFKNTIRPIPGEDSWEISQFDPESEELNTFRYVLRNKIDPLMRSTVEVDGVSQQFTYRYRLANGDKAVQNINYFWICCVPLQVFKVPLSEDYPQKTGDVVKDEQLMDVWRKRSRANAKFIVGAGRRYLQTPAVAWRPSLKQGDGSVGYGWLGLFDPDVPDDKRSYGMPSNTWSDDFSFMRPELPGVRIAKLQGSQDNDQFPGSYAIDTDDPELKAEIMAISRSDGRWLPVLAPVFKVNEPFDAAVFTRELWHDIENKWYRDDDYSLTLLSPEVAERLRQEFNKLIPLLEKGRIDEAKSAIAGVLKYMAQLTAPDSITPGNAGNEQASNDTAPLPATRTPITNPHAPDVASRTIHRVAARAVVFNLVYLQTHLRSAN